MDRSEPIEPKFTIECVDQGPVGAGYAVFAVKLDGLLLFTRPFEGIDKTEDNWQERYKKVILLDFVKRLSKVIHSA